MKNITTIRIFNGWEVRIETSVTGLTVRHHDAVYSTYCYISHFHFQHLLLRNPFKPFQFRNEFTCEVYEINWVILRERNETIWQFSW